MVAPTLYFFEGFGRYGSTSDIIERTNDNFGWRIANGTLLGSGGRNGGAALQLENNNLQGQFATNKVTCAIQLASNITVNGGNGGYTIGLVDNTDGTVQCYVTYEIATGRVKAFSGSTMLAQSAPLIVPAATWFSSSILATIAVGTGSIAVTLNGATVLTVSGVTTQQNGNAFFQAVSFLSTLSRIYITDILFSDSVVGADVSSVWIAPNGAGASTQFTPNPGGNANYQNIDGKSGGSDFNASNMVGTADLFTVPNATVIGATILGLEPGFQAARDVSGARSLAPQVKSPGGTITNETAWPLSTGPQIRGTPMPVDPQTGVAWLYTALPQVGYTVAA